MKDENREKLEALLDEEVSGPLGDKIMNLVEDIVNDEKWAAREEGRDAGFTVGWDSAMTSYMD